MSSGSESSQAAANTLWVTGALGGAAALALLIHSPWAGILAHRIAAPHAADRVALEGPTSTLNGETAAPAVATSPVRFEPLTPQQAQMINAATPLSAGRLAVMSPFVLTARAGDRDVAAASHCLALAVYHEAGGETDVGQAAVAQVVLNRVRHPLFPKTVCGVVFQGAELRTGCQFTFACDGSLSRTIDPRRWAQAQAVADRALSGYVEGRVGAATHYHTQWVVPYWKPSLAKLTQIGAHIFYRWPGGLGAPFAFSGAYAGGEPTGPGRDPVAVAPTPVSVAVTPLVVQPPSPATQAPIKVEVAALPPTSVVTPATPPKIELATVATPRSAESAISGSNVRLAVPKDW